MAGCKRGLQIGKVIAVHNEPDNDDRQGATERTAGPRLLAPSIVLVLTSVFVVVVACPGTHNCCTERVVVDADAAHCTTRIQQSK